MHGRSFAVSLITATVLILGGLAGYASAASGSPPTAPHAVHAVHADAGAAEMALRHQAGPALALQATQRAAAQAAQQALQRAIAAHIAHVAHRAHLARLAALAAPRAVLVTAAPAARYAVSREPVSHTYASGGGSRVTALQAAPAPAAARYTGGYPGGSFGQCVVARESGGNAQVMNSTGHYGLYQFSATTWAAYGGSPGSFGNASAAQQNQVFANALAQGGQSNWSPYDGCTP